MVMNDGSLKGIGYNKDGQISSTLQKTVIENFTRRRQRTPTPCNFCRLQFNISDIFTNFELSQSARENRKLVGECIGNALNLKSFLDLMNKGFSKIYPVEARYVSTPGIPPELIDPSIKFYSVTFSAFTISLKNDDEWKGNWIKYLGRIYHCEEELEFDLYHKFKKNEKVYVRTALNETLQKSRYGKFLEFGKNEGNDIPLKPEEKTFVQTVLSRNENGEEENTRGGCCSCCCCNNSNKK